MGQIIGRTAKPDACNIRSLSSFGIPAAGQHILVSTDNSVMQNGQGNFDAYVVGDGTTAATALPLQYLADTTFNKASKNAISAKAVNEELENIIYMDDSVITDITSTLTISEKSYNKLTGVANQNAGEHSDLIDVSEGDTFLVTGTYAYYTCLIAEFNSSGTFVSAKGTTDGSAINAVDFEYVVPAGVSKVGFSTREPRYYPIGVKKIERKTIKEAIEELDEKKADKTELSESIENKIGTTFTAQNGTYTFSDGVHKIIYNQTGGTARLTQLISRDIIPQEQGKKVFIGCMMRLSNVTAMPTKCAVLLNCVDGFTEVFAISNPRINEWLYVCGTYEYQTTNTSSDQTFIIQASVQTSAQMTMEIKNIIISEALQDYGTETNDVYKAILNSLNWNTENPLPIFGKTASLERILTNYKNDGILVEDKIVTVGTPASGDTRENYPSLTEAIQVLSKFYPSYRSGGIRCEVKILEGTTINEQIYVDGVDLSFITISKDGYDTSSWSFDDVAPLIASGSQFTAGGTTYTELPYVPVNADGWRGVTHDSRGDVCLFRAENGGRLPQINAVFKLTSNPQNLQVCGILCNRGAEAVVRTLCGFENFYDGVISNNESSITIREGVTMNCTRWGCHSRHNGEVSARSVIATGCGSSATSTECAAACSDRIADLDVREAYLGNSYVAIRCMNTSRINANGCHIIGGGASGVAVCISQFGSILNASGSEFTNLAGDIFAVNYGGEIVAFAPNITNVSGTTFNQEKNALTQAGIIFG